MTDDRRADSCAAARERVVETHVSLPTGAVPFLDDVTTSREARALLIYATSSPTGSEPDAVLSNADVIIFMHGFSQHPRNYRTLLHSLAHDHATPYVILAPTVSFSNVLLPWQHVETADACSSTAYKLQSAVVIDAARATRLAFERGAARIHIMGHSLGGMAALALAAHAPSTFTSVIALAPAVHASVDTHVNTAVTASAFDTGLAQFQLRVADLPILLVHGENDGVVGASESHAVFHALAARADGAVSVLAVVENGTHVGMEDCLDVRLHFPPVNLVAKAAFAVVDFFLFSRDHSQRSVQLPATMCLLRAWLRATPDAQTSPRKVVADLAHAARFHAVKLSTCPPLSSVNSSGRDTVQLDDAEARSLLRTTALDTKYDA